MQFLKQSTAVINKLGPFVDDGDGKTAETGLTIAQADIQLSKNGGAFAQTSEGSPTTTHDADGWYPIPFTTTDTATLGALSVQVQVAGALPVWREYMVVTANFWDSLCSTDKLQVDLTQILGTALTETGGQLAGRFKDFFDQASAAYHVATALSSFKATGFSVHNAAAVKTAIEAGGSSLAQILADTNELQTDDIPGTLSTIAGYLDTEIAAIKTVTDNLPDSGALTTIGLLLDAIPTTAEFNARTLAAGAYFDPTSDEVDANLTKMLGTAITETNAGDVAESWSQFWDVDPVTTKSVNDVGVAGSGLTPAQVWAYATRTLSSTGLDNVVVETGINARQALAIIGAAVAGVLSGADGTAIVIKNMDGSTTRIEATVDANGNRSALTLTKPA